MHKVSHAQGFSRTSFFAPPPPQLFFPLPQDFWHSPPGVTHLGLALLSYTEARAINDTHHCHTCVCMFVCVHVCVCVCTSCTSATYICTHVHARKREHKRDFHNGRSCSKTFQHSKLSYIHPSIRVARTTS